MLCGCSSSCLNVLKNAAAASPSTARSSLTNVTVMNVAVGTRTTGLVAADDAEDVDAAANAADFANGNAALAFASAVAAAAAAVAFCFSSAFCFSIAA